MLFVSFTNLKAKKFFYKEACEAIAYYFVNFLKCVAACKADSSVKWDMNEIYYLCYKSWVINNRDKLKVIKGALTKENMFAKHDDCMVFQMKILTKELFKDIKEGDIKLTEVYP
ncbi:hypothetical protein [Deferribacter autotrophicus]|uniref:hypothetical protein n=1 Tax=Deferribacter autotrophicus TaxID=500465 RepID=UPI0011EDB437|nr:hypothetical protein [Deferribacter autotrophicus]